MKSIFGTFFNECDSSHIIFERLNLSLFNINQLPHRTGKPPLQVVASQDNSIQTFQQLNKNN